MKCLWLSLALVTLLTACAARPEPAPVLPETMLGWWGPYSTALANFGFEIRSDGILAYKKSNLNGEDLGVVDEKIPYKVLHVTSDDLAYIVIFQPKFYRENYEIVTLVRKRTDYGYWHLGYIEMDTCLEFSDAEDVWNSRTPERNHYWQFFERKMSQKTDFLDSCGSSYYFSREY